MENTCSSCQTLLDEENMCPAHDDHCESCCPEGGEEDKDAMDTGSDWDDDSWKEDR